MERGWKWSRRHKAAAALIASVAAGVTAVGVLPLVFATGAGAAARRSMGTGVLGGMLAATFVATLFIPLFFELLSRRQARRIAAERLQDADATIVQPRPGGGGAA